MIKEFVRNHRKLAGLIVAALGLLVLFLMVRGKKRPSQVAVKERVTTVRAMVVPSVSVVPRALGYGYVQPGQTWDAVAEVAGTVVKIHPDLKKGSIIAKDEILLIIDPARSGLARKSKQASVDDILAQIRKLDQTEADTKRLLKLEENKLRLAKDDLERKRKLVKQGVLAKSELDDEETSYLSQKNAVQQLKNTLNSIPSERASLRAKLASARSSLEDAVIEEGKTVIRAPYDCRVSAVTVEGGQAVKVGEVLATLDSMGVSETLAQVPLYMFRNVIPRGEAPPLGGKLNMDKIRDFMGLKAIVRLRLPDGVVEWDGRVVRTSDAVDATTRTVGVYVAVDKPYIKARGGTRPPLIKNMYAEVVLLGKPRAPEVVIPRSAVHQGVVYVIDKDNRLRLRKVKTHSAQSGFVAVSEGLKAGTKIVLSDVIPAIDGMLVKPIMDDAALKALIDEAKGLGEVK